MKFLKSLWFVVAISLVLSMALLFFMMSGALKKFNEKYGDTHAPQLAIAPEKPIQYPANLTDDLKAFVAELERRDELIREREQDLENRRNSIRQELEEFDIHKKQILELQAGFDDRVKKFQDRRLFLEQAQLNQMKDLAATVEGLSPVAAVTLFLQMNQDEFKKAREEQGLTYAEPVSLSIPDETVTGIIELMDPKDFAPIMQEMTGGKEATDESKALAAALLQQLRTLVVEESADPNNGG